MILQIITIVFLKCLPKKIIIGKQGTRIRDIGTKARHDIKNLLGKQVFLKLFVKVARDWRNRKRNLDEMGIME
ncbi:MAG: KH domain-containing protein [Pyrinomonadaceae bacterium]